MPAATDVVYRVRHTFEGFDVKVKTYFSDEAFVQAIVSGAVKIDDNTEITRYIMTDDDCSFQIRQEVENLGGFMGVGPGHFSRTRQADRPAVRDALKRFVRTAFIR